MCLRFDIVTREVVYYYDIWNIYRSDGRGGDLRYLLHVGYDSGGTV